MKSYHGGGDSPPSNEAGATTLPTPPAAPSNLTATVMSESRIDLAWSDNSSDEGGFRVERKSGSGGFGQIGSTGANVAAFSDTTAAASTTYWYRVKATKGGSDSGPSNEASATTGSAASGTLSVPKTLNFGTVRVGSSKTKNLLIKNTSRTGSLRVTLSDPAAPFAIGGGDRSFTIPPRGSQAVTLAFTPTARGRRTGTLALTSSDPKKPSASVGLVGSGR